jgi:hypothetical protein
LELGEGPLGDEPTLVDDNDIVGEVFDFGEEMARYEHRPATRCVVAKPIAKRPDALGVEAVPRFVEDKNLWFAEQSTSQSETLPHAEGVGTCMAASGVGEADFLEDLIDTAMGDSGCVGQNPEVVAAASAGVVRIGLDHCTDRPGRICQVPIALPPDRRPAAISGCEIEHHLHRGGLARTVGAEKAGNSARLDCEAEVINN